MDPTANETNERGLRLLELAIFNNLILTNTLGPHKTPRRFTWHSPDRKHHNQTHYILVRKRFQSEVNNHRTRSCPGADTGSDHDMVMMIFRVRLKKTKNPTQSRLRLDLETLRNPDVAETFQATIRRKFASHQSGPEVIKLFSYSTQLSMKFKMLISMKISRNTAFFRLR